MFPAFELCDFNIQCSDVYIKRGDADDMRIWHKLAKLSEENDISAMDNKK